MATIDLDNYKFCGETIRSLNELLYDDTIKGPDITTIHDVEEGIVTGKEIGYIGKGGLLGKKHAGNCDVPVDPYTVNTRKVVWDPKIWKFKIGLCADELENTVGVFDRKLGAEMFELEDTKYMSIIQYAVRDSIRDMFYRFAWFADSAAAHITDGGTITDGMDLDYFNLTDGFWKQFLAGDHHTVTITENAGATYDAQELNPANVQGYLRNVIMRAPLLLRRQPNRMLLVTQSVYDAYEASLEGTCCTEAQYDNLVNGIEVLRYRGMPLIAMPIWDEMIAEYENTGTKLINPHRILFTTQENLGIGVDTTDSFENFKVWTEEKEDKVYVKGFGKFDAVVKNTDYYSLGI